MALSRITLTFQVDWQTGYGLTVVHVTSGAPGYILENVLHFRSASYTMTQGVPPTGITGEQTAINFIEAAELDYNSVGQFTFSRVGNDVQIVSNNPDRVFTDVGYTVPGGIPVPITWSIDTVPEPAPEDIPRTVIDGPAKITFCNSPVHLNIQNTAGDDSIRSVILRLWIWNGDQNKVLGASNVTYQKNIVSQSDNYVAFEIADVLKAYIERPTNATSANQPGFGYNVNALPAVSGQGVFWQIRAEVTSLSGVETIDYPTNFATLGWRWAYEQNGTDDSTIINHGSDGWFNATTPKKWYNPNVPKYWKQDFVFNQSIETCTSTNMVSIEVEEKTRMRCTRDSALIVFLDKRGLWDVFTPHGKIVRTPVVESTNFKRGFRRPNKVNNTIAHATLRKSIEVIQEYAINTGTIDESEVLRVEELIYSPKIYLIRFRGDVVYEIIDGLTIDSTLVTIDSTEITIDNTPIVVSQVPYFATYQQIPVVIKDPEFAIKTLLNDKNNIDYTLTFKETTNKINSLR